MMRLGDGTLAVSELELIEPGLYLDVLPGNAEPFADLVAAPRPASECTSLALAGRVLNMRLALSHESDNADR